jgi:hypothetical protein
LASSAWVAIPGISWPGRDRVLHPGHLREVGLAGLPPRLEPAAHLADLGELPGLDVEREQPYRRVRAVVPHHLGHLHGLVVVGGHVPGEAGVDRVDGGRPVGSRCR